MTRNEAEALRDNLAPEVKRLTQAIEALVMVRGTFDEMRSDKNYEQALRQLTDARRILRMIVNGLEDRLAE
jgi:hypothetical protein